MINIDEIFFIALRSSYSDINSQYLILLFSVLFFSFDFADATETFLLDYFLMSILFRKVSDLLLKVRNILEYLNFNQSLN